MEKFCSTCQQTKPITSFNKQSKSRDGYQYSCRDCQTEGKWKLRYGIDRAGYTCLLKKQSYRCAICGIRADDYASAHKTHKYLSVDHCHKSGTIRGLLCNNCNISLGAVGDRPEVLMAMIRYLERG